jgi:hypothetical protein
LVQPIQKTILEQRYKWDKTIKETHYLKIMDVMDEFYSFLGSVAHQVLEEAWHESMGGIVEERLYMAVHGEVLSGKMDRYVDGAIRDYKNTSVYKVMKGEYNEWSTQQNIYAHLCRKNGHPVTEIQIIALIRDFTEGQSFKKNYPSCAVKVIPIRVWDEAEAEGWIFNRILSIQLATQLNDSELTAVHPCSNEERWKNYKGTAVMKIGGKKASFLAKPEDYTQEEAMTACKSYWEMKDLDDTEYEIQVRWSEPKRCLKWCTAATVCKQYLAELADEEKDAKNLPF